MIDHSMDRRPLILHVLHHLVIGGTENNLVNLINMLPHDRWRHHVLCVEDYSEFRSRILRSDVEVVALNRSKVGVWRMRRRIYEECQRLRPAIVHTRALSGLDALPPAWLSGGAALLHSEHGWDVDNLKGRNRRPVLLRKLHSMFVDKYLVVSKDLQRYLVRQVGIRPSRINQVYNGVDTERFRPRASSSRVGLPEGFGGVGEFVVGTVGRLQAIKDQVTLLRAVALLRQNNPGLLGRIRLVIVGGGPLEQDLRAQASELKINDVTWFSGAVTNVVEILPNFDLFVLPSLMEGTSNTLLEAMACGVPVVATPVGGNLELIQEGRFGQFFAAGDAAALAAQIERYAASPSMSSEHGREARKFVEDAFSIPAMMSRYGALYESLLGLNKR